jgi:MFS family permease
MSLPHEIAFVFMVCTAQLLTQACLAQSITPAHIIGDNFGISNPGLLAWMPAAYSLTVGTFILPSGRLGDVFGHRRMFIIGYLWLAMWSLIAGFSVYSGQILFDICRAFQGIGPALLLPNAIAILGRTYPPGRRKDMVFSIFGSTAPGGFLVGAVFSALFGQLAWWPWAYFATAIAAACLAGASLLVIPTIPVLQVGQTTTSLVQRLDVFGILTGVPGLVLINFAWNQGPIVGWQTGYVFALLIVGFVLIVAFFFIETRVRCPLLPMHSLSRETGFVLGCVAAGWSSFGIWLYYLWQFMEVLRQETPLQATAYFVPVAISGLCAALTTGELLQFIPPGFVMLISMTAFTAGTVVLATLPVDRIYWAGIFISCVIMPWGMVCDFNTTSVSKFTDKTDLQDMSFPSGCIILSNNMAREHQGIAASLVNTAVNYSISIGLGMAGTVETHVNNGGLDVLKGYRGAWYLGIGLGALGIAVSVCFILFSSPGGKADAAGRSGSRTEEKLEDRVMEE